MSDRVLVNSHFTASEFRRAFRFLSSTELTVLHPSINLDQYDSREQKLVAAEAEAKQDDGTAAIRSAILGLAFASPGRIALCPSPA